MTKHIKEIQLHRKVLEEQNINQSLESLTSTISHDFRTPIATSLMFIEQLLELNLKPQAQRILLLIIAQLRLLLSLVNDILDIKLIK